VVGFFFSEIHRFFYIFGVFNKLLQGGNISNVILRFKTVDVMLKRKIAG